MTNNRLTLYHVDITTRPDERGDALGKESKIEAYFVAHNDCFFPMGGYSGVLGAVSGYVPPAHQGEVEEVVIRRVPIMVHIDQLTLERLVEEKKKR